MITARATGSVGSRAPARRRSCLQPGVRQGGQHDMAMPAGKRAALEVIEAEFVLQFLILLFDRPAMMRQADQRPQRRGRRQRDEVRLDARRRAEIALEEQPDFGREPVPRQSWAGVTRSAAKCAAHGRLRAVAPRDASPRARRQRGGDRPHGFGPAAVGQLQPRRRTRRPRLRGGTATVGVPRNTVTSTRCRAHTAASADAACGAAWRCRRIRHRPARR